MTLNAVADMVKEAERHASDLSTDRIRAVEYYRGEMKDTPSDEGRSRMVTRDVRAHIKKVLPSICRTILNTDEIVEYMPVGAGDEEGAAEASDYINYVVLPESDGRKAIYDAIHDALLLRNGILKWWFDERACVSVSRHTGLPEDAFAGLVASDDIEVIEHTEREEIVEGSPVLVHDCKIRRTFQKRDIKVAAVPRERFLIHPDATTVQDSLLVGEKMGIRRSDLVAMGYDREFVWGLSTEAEGEAETEESVRRDDAFNDDDEASRANEEIDYYDLYVRIDMDGDGIAELRHMCFAGGVREKNLLVDEECDDVQFCDIATMRQPHQWEGISLADDLMDLQRVKTVLLRQTLDNMYWQNNPQPIMQDGIVINPDSVYKPDFGQPIIVRPGASVRDALGFNSVPFVARDSFGMLEYLDGEAQDRTGVTDASAGMAPDALQNMTAKASAMIEQMGIGQTEFMVKTVAEGLRVFFRGLLKLVIRHQDMPRTVRLRDEWVTFDPRHWNAGMDCTVNTGLGAGTRERDMAMMQVVMGAQEKLIAGFGPDNPFVKPENVYAALSKFVESAGLKTPALYFTEPDPEEVKAQMEAMKNQPSPEMQKVQAEAQAEQAKIQSQAQAAQQKAQSDHVLALQRMNSEAELKREQMNAEIQLKREQMTAEMQLKREQMALEATIQSNMPTGDVRFGGSVG